MAEAIKVAVNSVIGIRRLLAFFALLGCSLWSNLTGNLVSGDFKTVIIAVTIIFFGERALKTYKEMKELGLAT